MPLFTKDVLRLLTALGNIETAILNIERMMNEFQRAINSKPGTDEPMQQVLPHVSKKKTRKRVSRVS